MDVGAVVQQMVQVPTDLEDQTSTEQTQSTTFVSQTVTTIITARTDAFGHVTSGVSESASKATISWSGWSAYPIAQSPTVDGQVQLLMRLIVFCMMVVALLMRRRGMVGRKRQEETPDDLSESGFLKSGFSSCPTFAQCRHDMRISHIVQRRASDQCPTAIHTSSFQGQRSSAWLRLVSPKRSLDRENDVYQHACYRAR